MNSVNRYTNDTLCQLSESALPPAPFPRKHIHCVFDDAQDAIQAILTLLASEYDADNIHMLINREYLVAMERRQTFLNFLLSMDLNKYIQEAKLGRTLLVVRPHSYEQIIQVRSLLFPHHARMMNYIDTWTTTALLP